MSIKDIMPNAVLRSKAGYLPPLTHPRYSTARDPQGASPRTLCVPLWLWGLATAPHGAVVCCPARGSCVLLPPRLVQGDVACCLWLYLPDSVCLLGRLSTAPHAAWCSLTDKSWARHCAAQLIYLAMGVQDPHLITIGDSFHCFGTPQPAVLWGFSPLAFYSNPPLNELSRTPQLALWGFTPPALPCPLEVFT